MEGSANRPWMRRDDESHRAYEGFRLYLKLRSQNKVATEMDNSMTIVSRWCAQHDWVKRATAYDSYVVNAEADGAQHDVAVSKNANLTLVGELRDHLRTLLAIHVQRKEPPTVRWTQALVAMVRLEEAAFKITDEAKTSEKVVRVEALLEKLIEERQGSV